MTKDFKDIDLTQVAVKKTSVEDKKTKKKKQVTKLIGPDMEQAFQMYGTCVKINSFQGSRKALVILEPEDMKVVVAMDDMVSKVPMKGYKFQSCVRTDKGFTKPFIRIPINSATIVDSDDMTDGDDTPDILNKNLGIIISFPQIWKMKSDQENSEYAGFGICFKPSVIQTEEKTKVKDFIVLPEKRNERKKKEEKKDDKKKK
jgi:hypothetical protein